MTSLLHKISPVVHEQLQLTLSCKTAQEYADYLKTVKFYEFMLFYYPKSSQRILMKKVKRDFKIFDFNNKYLYQLVGKNNEKNANFETTQLNIVSWVTELDITTI